MPKSDLLARLDRLNTALDQFLQQLQQHDQAVLDRRPASGRWSAMDVLHHLHLAEGYAHKYIAKKLSFDPDIPAANLSSRLRTSLMKAFFASPTRRKAPQAVDTPSFPQGVSIEELREDWMAQRQQLYDYLQELDEKWIDKQVYKHPFAGRLTLDGMLTFFESHLARHKKQVKRTLAEVAQPG
jgi:hypothetical protein